MHPCLIIDCDTPIFKKKINKGLWFWPQGAVRDDSAPSLIGSGRRRRPTGRWSSALTPTSWETAGTGCMRTGTTGLAMETQLHCRSAGVEFPRAEWMHTCTCGPGRETMFTSSKAGLENIKLHSGLHSTFYDISLVVCEGDCCFSTQALGSGGMTARMTRFSGRTQKVTAIRGRSPTDSQGWSVRLTQPFMTGGTPTSTSFETAL